MGTSVTILGSGNARGVPVVGCSCSVCRSSEPKNRRGRTGLLIEHEGKKLLIDASPDLREQLLRHSITRLNGICLTHYHFDHVGGLFDLLPLWRSQGMIPCLLSTATRKLIENDDVWSVFLREGAIEVQLSERVVLNFAGFPPIHCSFHEHSGQFVTAYRFGSFAFVTDIAVWNESTAHLLSRAEMAFIGVGDWRRIRKAHCSIEEALSYIGELKQLKKVYFTHLSHHVDYNKMELPLGDKGNLGWDGLKVEFTWKSVRGP
ncbi:MBL fold metallo-hydrolase [Candidatus Similichlamydia laticola]|uniref:Metal-dependent hydrolases of the beta-lactamase superfamily n=1 Tax=Candidatus Similichlamydia laticola TaxID=2170265 RepID=A0A369KD39_9BACT|nr:MBL fold metallo-hydrolase [Candidatus Similichlamydia laticola]RDB31522.1 Metal-dependent hydrolases of the beta-lactamase superfamily [Candidatus Similichlamydia laticola]